MADRAQGSVTEGKGKNNFDDHTISAIIKSAIWYDRKQKLLQGGDWIVRSSDM